MHTISRKPYWLHHNGDFSGDVEISVPKEQAQVDEPDGRVYVRVPMSLLRAVVAKEVRAQRVRELEDMEDHEVLGLEKERGS